MGGLIIKHSVSKALIADQVLRQNVPETKIYSKSALKMMLGKYTMVYIKPNRGTGGNGGNGVIRVQKAGPGQYKYQLQTTTKKFTSSDDLINSLELEIQGSSYVIQRGIHLLRHNNRLFDLRIMVQKNLEGQWETTGIIGRVGHPAKIITNVCRGGVSKPVEVLLKEHVTDVPAYVKKLKSLG